MHWYTVFKDINTHTYICKHTIQTYKNVANFMAFVRIYVCVCVHTKKWRAEREIPTYIHIYILCLVFCIFVCLYRCVWVYLCFFAQAHINAFMCAHKHILFPVSVTGSVPYFISLTCRVNEISIFRPSEWRGKRWSPPLKWELVFP